MATKDEQALNFTYAIDDQASGSLQVIQESISKLNKTLEDSIKLYTDTVVSMSKGLEALGRAAPDVSMGKFQENMDKSMSSSMSFKTSMQDNTSVARDLSESMEAVNSTLLATEGIYRLSRMTRGLDTAKLFSSKTEGSGFGAKASRAGANFQAIPDPDRVKESANVIAESMNGVRDEMLSMAHGVKEGNMNLFDYLGSLVRLTITFFTVKRLVGGFKDTFDLFGGSLKDVIKKVFLTKEAMIGMGVVIGGTLILSFMALMSASSLVTNALIEDVTNLASVTSLMSGRFGDLALANLSLTASTGYTAETIQGLTRYMLDYGKSIEDTTKVTEQLGAFTELTGMSAESAGELYVQLTDLSGIASPARFRAFTAVFKSVADTTSITVDQLASFNKQMTRFIRLQKQLHGVGENGALKMQNEYQVLAGTITDVFGDPQDLFKTIDAMQDISNKSGQITRSLLRTTGAVSEEALAKPAEHATEVLRGMVAHANQLVSKYNPAILESEEFLQRMGFASKEAFGNILALDLDGLAVPQPFIDRMNDMVLSTQNEVDMMNRLRESMKDGKFTIEELQDANSLLAKDGALIDEQWQSFRKTFDRLLNRLKQSGKAITALIGLPVFTAVLAILDPIVFGVRKVAESVVEIARVAREVGRAMRPLGSLVKAMISPLKIVYFVIRLAVKGIYEAGRATGVLFSILGQLVYLAGKFTGEKLTKLVGNIFEVVFDLGFRLKESLVEAANAFLGPIKDAYELLLKSMDAVGLTNRAEEKKLQEGLVKSNNLDRAGSSFKQANSLEDAIIKAVEVRSASASLHRGEGPEFLRNRLASLEKSLASNISSQYGISSDQASVMIQKGVRGEPISAPYMASQSPPPPAGPGLSELLSAQERSIKTQREMVEELRKERGTAVYVSSDMKVNAKKQAFKRN